MAFFISVKRYYYVKIKYLLITNFVLKSHRILYSLAFLFIKFILLKKGVIKMIKKHDCKKFRGWIILHYFNIPGRIKMKCINDGYQY